MKLTFEIDSPKSCSECKHSEINEHGDEDGCTGFSYDCNLHDLLRLESEDKGIASENFLYLEALRDENNPHPQLDCGSSCKLYETQIAEKCSSCGTPMNISMWRSKYVACDSDGHLYPACSQKCATKLKIDIPKWEQLDILTVLKQR